MTGDNVVSIIKSPAFTVLMVTVCLILVMNHVPVVVGKIKAIKKAD